MPIKKRSSHLKPLTTLLREAQAKQSDAEWSDDMTAAALWADEAERIKDRLEAGELYGVA